MDYNRDPMDFSRHDDKAYFMIGNLVSNGEVVGERFIGLPCFAEKICLGGALPETVDVKMADWLIWTTFAISTSLTGCSGIRS